MKHHCVIEVSLEQHSKLLKENVTKNYKLAESGDYNDINMEARNVAEKLQPKLSTRMEPMAKREAYITMKDHKDNFENNLPCRLINLAKGETGMISKRILERVNHQLKTMLNAMLWRNSAEVIKWFSSIQKK